RLEVRAERRASVDGKCSERRSVVGAAPGDELVAASVTTKAVVLARDLQGALDRLRPSADEEDAPDVDWQELGELLGELHRGRRGEADPVGDEGELLGRLGRGLRDR